jgi:hypothetical protein
MAPKGQERRGGDERQTLMAPSALNTSKDGANYVPDNIMNDYTVPTMGSGYVGMSLVA